jgi:hypothetical protein
MDKNIILGYFSDNYSKVNDTQYLHVFHCDRCDKPYKIWTIYKQPLNGCPSGHIIPKQNISVVEKRLDLVKIDALPDFTSKISVDDYNEPVKTLVKRIAYLEQKIIDLVGNKP